MKIRKETLKRIIKEELQALLYESQDSAMMGIMAASMLGMVGLLKDYSEMRAARFSQDEVELSFDQRVESDMQMFNDIKAEFSAAEYDYYTTTRDDSRETTLNIPLKDYADIVRETSEDPLQLENKNQMLWNRVQQINLEYNPELGYKR